MACATELFVAHLHDEIALSAWCRLFDSTVSWHQNLQADDGAAKMITLLEDQVANMTGQKSQLMNKVMAWHMLWCSQTPEG
jgi:hypothetical protein